MALTRSVPFLEDTAMRTSPVWRQLVTACGLAAAVCSAPVHADATLETNAFRFFDPSPNAARANHPANAYLLAIIARFVYPPSLFGEADSRVIHNDATFGSEFALRTAHYFFDPVPPRPPTLTAKAPVPPCVDKRCPCAIYDANTRLARSPAQLAAQHLSSAVSRDRLRVQTAPVRRLPGGGTLKSQRITLEPQRPAAMANASPRVRYTLSKGRKPVSKCEEAQRRYNASYAKYETAVARYQQQHRLYERRLAAWNRSIPVINFHATDGTSGHDPEAMVISTPRFVLVAFRGTDRVSNAATMLGFEFGEWGGTNARLQMREPDVEGITGRVHSGFWDSLRQIAEAVTADVVAQGGRRGGKPVWLTGHSLGGAHSQLFAAYLQATRDITPAGAYVYASPHVGDAQFVHHLENYALPARLQRFDFMDDLVTMMFPYAVGYQRAGIRNFYASESGSANYFFDTEERPPAPVNSLTLELTGISAVSDLCKHHTEWYVRATYNELPASLRGQMPPPPAAPDDSFPGCLELEVNDALNPRNA